MPEQIKRPRGRPKGSRSKRTLAKENAFAAVNAIGKTPLQVLLELMAKPGISPEFQADLATKAAPYCHPRFTSMEFRERKADGSVEARRRLSNAERARALLLLAAEAQVPEDGADNDDGVDKIGVDTKAQG